MLLSPNCASEAIVEFVGLVIFCCLFWFGWLAGFVLGMVLFCTIN